MRSRRSANLRKRAEKLARGKPLEHSSLADPALLIEELRVHQIELELQNEELRRTQQQLEESRHKYFELFDLAPVGYVTIGRNGLIKELNLAAATMLGIERRGAGHFGFGSFVSPPFQDEYQEFRRTVSAAHERGNCELELVSRTRRRFYAHCEGLAAEDGSVRMTIADVTERHLAEQALRKSNEGLEQNREKVAELSTSLFEAQEGERRRASHELHDALSQKFAMLAVEADILERDLAPEFPDVCARLSTLRNRIAELSDDIRRIAYELHPSSGLEHPRLTAALHSLCAEFSKLNGIQVTFQERDVPPSIPPDVAFCLYRIAQESFHNVVKHAKSAEVSATLTMKKRRLALTIIDHGGGLKLWRSGEEREGLGLVSMEQRVKLVNGGLKLSSLRGKGTRIEAWVPLLGDAQ